MYKVFSSIWTECSAEKRCARAWFWSIFTCSLRSSVVHNRGVECWNLIVPSKCWRIWKACPEPKWQTWDAKLRFKCSQIYRGCANIIRRSDRRGPDSARFRRPWKDYQGTVCLAFWSVRRVPCGLSGIGVYLQSYQNKKGLFWAQTRRPFFVI